MRVLPLVDRMARTLVENLPAADGFGSSNPRDLPPPLRRPPNAYLTVLARAGGLAPLGLLLVPSLGMLMRPLPTARSLATRIGRSCWRFPCAVSRGFSSMQCSTSRSAELCKASGSGACSASASG
jgi:hypothetical protein